MFKIALERQLQCTRNKTLRIFPKTARSITTTTTTTTTATTSHNRPFLFRKNLQLICKRHKLRIPGARVESHGYAAVKDVRPPRHIQLFPESKYGGEHTVTLLTGDTAIGKQGSKYVRSLFEITKVPIFFERIQVTDNEEYENEYVKSVLRNRNAIHIDAAHDPDRKSKNSRINSSLNLFASVIKLHCFEGYNCRFPELDLLLMLQNNTGDYTKLEYEPVNGVVETLCIAEENAVHEYLDFVFDYATQHCRKKITMPHKMSALPRTDGMFLRIAHDLQKQKYPHLAIERMSVGKMSLALVECPMMFDVICAGDRYGTFLTAIASAVCGGASLFSAIEMNRTHAVFKPLETKLSITNTTVLSPYGVVRACVDLLAHIGNDECAHYLWKELLATMLDRNIKTKEFQGKNREEFVICDILNNLRCKFA